MFVNIAINFGLILWGAISTLYKSLRFKYYTRKRDKLLAKLKKDNDLRE